jgi:hypothetical protein
VQRRFDLFGTEVNFGSGGRIEWSLDPLSGHRYPLAPSRRLRLAEPGVDPKYPWALGRLDQLLALGQGYWVASRSEEQEWFASEFEAQIRDFIDANPVGLGVHWVNPMEVALRAVNLAFGLAMFGDAGPLMESQFQNLMLRSLVDHCRFVEAHLEDAVAVPNNHLVANHLGLLVVGLLFPELPRSPRLVSRALAGLRAEMERQVFPDGYSFEGSVPYHRLACELFTLAYLVAQDAGADLGEGFRGRLQKMFQVANAYCSEQGRAPQIGDNDSGRAFPLCDRQSLDHGYLPAFGAALFEDPGLKRPGAVLPDEAAWLLGRKGLEKFTRLQETEPPALFNSPGGLCVLRAPGLLVAVSTGRTGQNGIGGHSHNDKLSFELHLNGHPVVVDPGTGTYLRYPQTRNAFRSTAAHNTVEINDREQSTFDPRRLFALPSALDARVERLETAGGRTTLVVGYHSPKRSVRLRRIFLLDEAQKTLLVFDRIEGTGSARVRARLHFPDHEVRLRPLSAAEHARARLAAEPGVFVGETGAELGPAEFPRALAIPGAGLGMEVGEGDYSPSYGQIQPAAKLVYGSQGELPITLTLLVLFNQRAGE